MSGKTSMSWISGKKVAAASVLLGMLVACTSIPEAEPSCANDGCGPHGTCTFVGDSESCVCEAGYSGPTCADCAPGFQDIDGNGLCAGSCADLACGAHERCSEVSGRPLCDCVVGYTRTDEGVCVFTGGPVDPSFDNPQPNGWATRGAARIEVGNPSDVAGGRGWARFGGLGEVFQSFEMPSYADAEPLALELERACTRMGSCGSMRGPLSIAFDDRLTDHWLFVGQKGPPETVQVCLGERAFGRKLTFGLRAYPSLDGADFGRPQDALIGRAQFVPSVACAAPGTVKNGDFEAGDWKIAGAHEGVPGATFVEENGTRLARLESVCAPDQPPISGNIVTSISIPEALEQPAIAFSLDGTLGGRTRVSLDGRTIGVVPGSGAREKAVVCLPASSSGFAFELRVDAEADCGSRKRNVVRVDDFVVTSDPSCVADETVINGGFERTGVVAWNAEPPGPETAVVIQDPARAHSGTAYLELRASCSFRIAIGHWTGLVPPRPPDAGGGPAVKLWYRLPSESNVDVRAGDTYMPEPAHRLAPATTWTERVVCLPSHSWGRPTGLRIELFPSGNAVEGCMPGQLELDDISIALDPSCPLD
ncbi:MAG: hypothetical protein BGO98_32500 [Myxococcales bacterium 68-20]|nr:MAG: hypothetical protein BGO98_32500 [Myxococcales bacterium 68-20]